MRKPNHNIGHILALITCSIAIVSCDSPITIYEPSDFGRMSTGYPIQGFDGKPSNSESDVLRRRLFDAYVDYWPLISSEDQHKRLPKVLTDPIPEIRAFGVERVAVLLRDGEAMEEELQLVTTLLQDPHPTVRLAVAKLLPEINIAGKRIEHSEDGPMSLPEYVATALEKEKRQSIAALELAFFQTRPHSNAVKPSIKRLESGPIDPAAKTIFALLNSKMFEIEDDQKRQIFKIVQRHLRINNISKLPSLITLNAMLGSPTVKQGLVHLLQNSDKSIAIAVAQGFAAAGFAEPLMERADDRDLYVHALMALQNRGGIEAIQDLMLLHTENAADWDAAVMAIATSLDISSLLRADDILHRRGLNTLRLSILEAIWKKSTSKDRPERIAIAKRAAPLLIETGDAVRALQLLDELGESLQEKDLIALRFNAAIAASAWDAAANTHPEPTPWIEAWKSKANEPTTANAIRKQISIRFEDQLTASQRDLLGLVKVDATPSENP